MSHRFKNSGASNIQVCECGTYCLENSDGVKSFTTPIEPPCYLYDIKSIIEKADTIEREELISTLILVYERFVKGHASIKNSIDANVLEKVKRLIVHAGYGKNT